MKVAIYCRLSEEDRNKQSENDDSESIQNQKTMLIDYAIRQDWQIYNIYSDDDYKGSDRKRPEFNQLLKDAESRNFDIILCKTQSRFTRELELVEKYIHTLFPIWGIRFIGLVDNADTENRGNKKQRQINGLVNEWYLEDLSESIRSVFNTKKKNGHHIGSFALYGYKKDPKKKGHIIIDEEAAKVVREVFELFAQGYSKTPIARMLNEKGIPNPTEYKRQKGLRYRAGKQNSTLWKYYAIGYMLKNEMYIGTMVQNRQRNVSYKSQKKIQIPKSEWIRIPNMHEPIIDIDLWNKVQKLIQSRTRPWGDTGKPGRFAKKVKCMYCGYYMRSQKTHGDRYLQCTTRHFSKESCIGAHVSEKLLEKVVLQELNKMIDEYDIRSDVENQIIYKENNDEIIAKLTADINSYQAKFNEATQAVKNLYIDKTRGIITDDEFIEFSKEFHQAKDNYKKLILKCEKEIKEFEDKVEIIIDRKQIFQEYGGVETLERIHIDSLVDFIEVGQRIPGTKNREINIHWKI